MIRRLVVGAAGALAALTGAFAANAPAATAHGAATPVTTVTAGADAAADRLPVTVAVSSLNPVSIAPGDVVTVTATFTNTTDDDVHGLSLSVGAGNRITSRASLERDLADAPGIREQLKTTPVNPLPTTLAAHASVVVPFTIGVNANALNVSQPTVYPLIVRVTGLTGRASRATLGECATYLPYFPAAVAAPLQVVWIWPVDASPAIDAGSKITDPDRAASFDASGRLRNVLNLGALSTSSANPGGPYAPVTWAIEPSVLDSADLVGTSASRSWLTDLTSVTRGQDVIPLPYADIDAVSVVRAGLTSDLTNAIALGRSEIGSRLPAAQLQSVAWPADGALDQPTLDAYAGAGLTRVLVSGDQVPPSADADSATESAPVMLDTRGPEVRGLAIDPIAQKLLAGQGKSQPSPQMDRQQLLALLAVAVGERPNQTPSRDLVLTLPRGMDPDSNWISGLLHDTASLQWLRAVRLSETAADPVGQRSGLGPYPDSARDAELPASALTGNANAVADLRRRLADLRSMLPDDKLIRPIDQTLIRSESVFWRPRADPAGRAPLVASANAALTTLSSGVRLAVANVVTLTSKDVKVPVTVENLLSEPVTVRVQLTAADRTRLAETPPQTYTLLPNQKQRVLIAARPERSGSFKVSLVATTPNGVQIARVPLTVHSKAYGTITLVITFTALGVLVLALAYRAQRKLRAWRSGRSGRSGGPDDRGPHPGPGTPPGPGETDGAPLLTGAHGGPPPTGSA